MQTANHVHQPRKKNPGSGNTNPRKRIWYKEGTSTMLFCKNATTNSAKVLIASIKDNMSKLGLELNGHFLVTQ